MVELRILLQSKVCLFPNLVTTLTLISPLSLFIEAIWETLNLFHNFFFQNAGAVIGKGGKNIKALRTDVSIYKLNLDYFAKRH